MKCMTSTLPVLGFVGSSGSGKTTLLERVVPLLSDAGVRLAVMKHARPGFDVDPDPTKDSHRLHASGAEQLLVASRDRWVLMAQQDDPLQEPPLDAMLRRLDADVLDAVLVEGFSHERYPKIEVYRPAHGRLPQCWPHDPAVVAVASDVPSRQSHFPGSTSTTRRPWRGSPRGSSDCRSREHGSAPRPESRAVAEPAAWAGAVDEVVERMRTMPGALLPILRAI
jgi:molybdopterin-guanine dinucleotide biosynthesis protein B